MRRAERAPEFAPEFMKRLAADVSEARKLRHMTTLQLADAIGISESALRRIENLTSHNTRGETWIAIMLWAASRGYREFAGFSIKTAGEGSVCAKPN